MKIIQQQNWVFTLYEDEHGQFVLDVLFPAKKLSATGVTRAARGRETAGRGSPAAEGLLLSDSKCE